MDHPEFLAKLKEGTKTWNHWRESNPAVIVDLRTADLRKLDLREADFHEAKLLGADFSWTDLRGTNFREADLSWSTLREADFSAADLRKADLHEAQLWGANLGRANLGGANLGRANLSGANLTKANLSDVSFDDANLREANLYEANLAKANFRKANLGRARLGKANLSRACLSKANLNRSELYGAHLISADLSDADLEIANLSGADCRKANFSRANLGRADLSKADLREATLTEAFLGSARLQSVQLDRAILTDARLWETQRAGWSIKNIICERAYWDAQSVEGTRYSPGEFEEIYSEQPRIELFYQGGLTKFELNTIPALLKHLATLNPDCTIRLRSVEETGGGAKVSISVGDVDSGRVEQIKTEAEQSQAAQVALRDNPVARWEIEKRLLLDEIFPRMLATAGQHVEITGSATGVIIASGYASVNAQHTINESGPILSLLHEVMSRNEELGLEKDQTLQLEKVVRSVEQELHTSEPKRSVVSSGLKIVKEIAVKVIENTAEKALTDHWHPLIDQLTHFVNLLTR